MSLLLLLLLLVRGSEASHFLGTTTTYYPKTTRADGSVEVVIRYKMNFHACGQSTTWRCKSGNCGNQLSLALHRVDQDSGGRWCQNEGIMTRLVPGGAPFSLWLDGGNWINNIVNGIIRWRALTLVDLRNRSDTGRANGSPQTTVLPELRVPSNCPRDLNLLNFDPDGDRVKCRYGNASLSECNPCTPPSVLNLSSSCTLSFRPTNAGAQGPYAVQLVMEDFPRQTITLTQTGGTQTTVTATDAISKIPVQFILRVDPAAPSCTEGLYVPKFLPPTPADGTRLFAPVNQTLEIGVRAEANVSTVSALLFSGPYNVNRTRTGPGRFTLRWTPSAAEDGQSHPFCFVVQANTTVKFHSELRCVVVSVGHDLSSNTTAETPTAPDTTPASGQIVLRLTAKISSSAPLSAEDLRTDVMQQFKEELQKYGVPSDVTLTLLNATRT